MREFTEYFYRLGLLSNTKWLLQQYQTPFKFSTVITSPAKRPLNKELNSYALAPKDYWMKCSILPKAQLLVDICLHNIVL